MHNNKTYAVINLTDVGLIDFSQIGESSVSTIRKSLDDTQFVIKWEEGYIPTFITDGSVDPVEQYDHQGILELMQTPDWNPPLPPTLDLTAKSILKTTK
tara:strand:+ start:1268 stop:1564 length:297 start_codon:yes stop_codon:yes gene_type:complete